MAYAEGIESAFSEITLVFFTTLGPAGALSFCLLAALVLSRRLARTDEERLLRYLIVPVVVTLVAFVASATHLGSPSNALYVFMGVGRSPLSNEVVVSVGFFILAALCWMMSFSKWSGGAFHRVLLGVASIAGVTLIVAVSLAYRVRTVPTWDSVYAPFSQIMLAGVLGPFVAMLTLDWGETKPPRSYFVTLHVLATAALAASVTVFVLQCNELGSMVNSWMNAPSFAPLLAGAIAVYAVIEAGAIIRSGLERLGKKIRQTHPFTLFAVSAGGVLVMRFAFYALHMTVGL